MSLSDGDEALSPWLAHQSGVRPVESVPVKVLRSADSPRTAGEDANHVYALAEVDAPLPPIIVYRPTMRVVDGMHRLRAALLRAREEIEVQFFDGTEDDAFVLAVEANTRNGLPLSLADRRVAAARIMSTHPHRSDRWTAQVSGLSANTVGAMRKYSNPGGDGPTARVGRDGRVRPLDSSDGRRIAGELMRANPGRSLRDIARVAGIAPSTALDVRRRLQSGADPAVTRRKATEAETGPVSAGTPQPQREVNPEEILRRLRNDPSLRFTEAGKSLLRWLGAHTVEDGLAALPLDAIPTHCIGTVADLAQYNAGSWARLSEQLAALRTDRRTTDDAPRTGERA
ncbi:streptomycin biosynthesis protein [Umezawaea tangerina]|uniref:ParB-like chromosome segregation protein Spo0J n=1 Tax=Umezawaea tangerina TaxID=84725 RepID=A0A2T0T6M6_9PSEU|nr:streptomycin biosynthesis protein [Umezawaea tangerina]PRY41291.1 ParB-like chromosome segregation protein Spo0J [Umezawaea tangerina]